jgi:hypothetical protein
VPAEYFLLTFTLPEELRALAWQQLRTLYDLMIRCSWETVKTFAQNDRRLQGNSGKLVSYIKFHLRTPGLSNNRFRWRLRALHSHHLTLFVIRC